MFALVRYSGASIVTDLGAAMKPSLAELLQHYDPATPLDEASTIPSSWYIDERIAVLERSTTFARTWQMAGRVDQVRNPGDYVTCEIAGEPILVVRGDDGVLRGFFNVCRHHAAAVMTEAAGCAKNLRCPYHGWTYTLEGLLRSAPEMQGAADFDVNDIRLPPLRVHAWQGLVFVAVDEDVPPFDAVYGGIAERIAPIDLATMRFHRRDSYDIGCNWKVYVDNFLEGYHLPHVHPGLSKVLDYRAYDTELFPWHSLQHSPLRNSGDIYGDGDAFYYFVYPNVMLNIMPGRLQTNHILPLGADRCRVEFDYYYAQDDAALARIANDQAFSDEVQDEDIRICESVQQGLASGLYDAGRLCPKRESGVWHFHNLLRAAYGDA